MIVLYSNGFMEITHTLHIIYKKNAIYGVMIMEPPTMLLVPICRDKQFW